MSTQSKSNQQLAFVNTEPSIAAQNILFKNLFTSALVLLTFNREALSYFSMLYAYTRWIDDISDSLDYEIEDKRITLERQITIVEMLYAKIPVKVAITPERWLCLLIQKDIARNCILQTLFKEMIELFLFDAERQHAQRIPSADELTRYMRGIGRCAFNAAHYFLFPDCSFSVYDNSCLGEGIQLVHALRDLEFDLNCGIINIAVEDMTRFGIAKLNLSDQGVQKWIHQQGAQAKRLIAEGRRELHSINCWSSRLLWNLYASKYLLILSRL